MSKKTKALVTVPQDEVMKRLKFVNEQIEKIGDRSREPYICEHPFKFNPTSRHADGYYISQCDLSMVRNIARFLMQSKHYAEIADEFLGLNEKGVEVPVRKWGQYTHDQWLSDCQLRVHVLRYDEKLRKLRNMKNMLEGLIEEETKKAMQFNSLTDQLNDLGFEYFDEEDE